MAREYVYVQKEGDIATVFLNRPEKRNALDYEMWLKIATLVKQCDEDREVKIIIFRGVDETAFAAGADISEFQTLRSSVAGAAQYNIATLEAEHAISHVSKPTIAMVQGYCVGGGCEIAIACDFRFSDSCGKFGITPARLGLVYNASGTKALVDLVGPAKAKDILFTGRLLDAEEALHIGLIDRVYAPDEIVDKTHEFARLIARNAQFSVRGAKYIINRILSGMTEDAEDVTQLVLRSFDTEDYKEGVQAFLEKRNPNFKYS